jgi:hypothetical protein
MLPLRPPRPHQAAAVAQLQQYIRERADALHRPDAWVHARTRQLTFAAAPDEDGWVALRIGDVVCLSMAVSVTHDMIYVGRGCVVHLLSSGRAEVQRLDGLHLVGGRLYVDQDAFTVRSRLQVAETALASTGYHRYEWASANCEVFVARALGQRGVVAHGVVTVTLYALLSFVVFIVGAALVLRGALPRKP